MYFELSILDFIQNHLKCGFMDTAMPLITRSGDGGTLWIVFTIIMLIIPRTRKTGIAMAISLALEFVCCNAILKPLVARTRPCDVNAAFSLLIPRPMDYGFPSGHTGASFAAAASLYFSRNHLWIPSAAIAALIAFSRLYLYVHYPSDVLAGALLGIMLGRLGNFIAGSLPIRS